MFNNGPAKPITPRSIDPSSLGNQGEVELLELREHINALLPPKLLKDIDLETEMALQFQIARAIQTRMMGANEEPQKVAVVLNACANALQNLVKMQAEHYTAERLKNIETRLIKALDKVPKEYLIEFFAFYESDNF